MYRLHVEPFFSRPKSQPTLIGQHTALLRVLRGSVAPPHCSPWAVSLLRVEGTNGPGTLELPCASLPL